MKGHHILGMLHGNVIINKTEELIPYMENIVRILKLTEVSRAFHQFEPCGVTGVIVLSESHFSVHTYPEDDKIYLDIFCCSKDFDPNHASDVILNEFKAELFQWEYISR